MAGELMQRDAEALKRLLDVHLKIDVRGDSMSVEAVLANRTGQRIHVLNVLWDFSPNGAISAPDSPSYVCVRDTELRLAHRALPNPPKPVPVRIVPHASAVEVGGTLRENMRFDVPVREYSCYYRWSAGAEEEAVTCVSARMSYDVIVGAPDAAFVRSAATQGLQIVDGRQFERAITVESEPIACSVPTLRRKATFARF